MRTNIIRALKLAAVWCLVAAATQLSNSVGASSSPPSGRKSAGEYNVQVFGATGDGKTLDTAAINKAIDAAASAGGGTVFFPAGNYLSVSIHLKSNITLYLDSGATIIAADPREGIKYDEAEPNIWDKYDDFGHTHWHNSLIWGENLENVSIEGPGRIWGKGLVRKGVDSRTDAQNNALRNYMLNPKDAPFGYPNPNDRVEPGWANKSISLKLCRNVVIRDISILHGGHIAILATGVDNLTIDNVRVDTNRDGINIDACRGVRISNCSVNAPLDDAICLKSSFALGYLRPTENVTITNCQVSGYDEGTFFDGTYKREYSKTWANKATGRIKLGTESNGGFRNITISNCVFDHSQGLALESVDGGSLEDVVIANITMRDVTSAPIFVRLGNRGRGPKDFTTVGAIRRVQFSNVIAYNVNPNYGAIVSGIPGHAIEDIRFSNIQIHYLGGKARQRIAVPENEQSYPDPDMFGITPAYGFFIRHVKGIAIDNVNLSFAQDDLRPPFVLNDVMAADFARVKAQHVRDVPTFILHAIENFRTTQCHPIADVFIEKSKATTL